MIFCIYLYLKRRRKRLQYTLVVVVFILLMQKVLRNHHKLQSIRSARSISNNDSTQETCTALFMILHFRISSTVNDAMKGEIKEKLEEYTNGSSLYIFVDEHITDNGLPRTMQKSSYFIRGSGESNRECGYVWSFDTQNQEIIYDTCKEKTLKNSWKFCKLQAHIVNEVTTQGLKNFNDYCSPNLAASWPLQDVTKCVTNNNHDMSSWVKYARSLDKDLMNDVVSNVIGYPINAWQVLGLVVEYDKSLLSTGFTLLSPTESYMTEETTPAKIKTPFPPEKEISTRPPLSNMKTDSETKRAYTTHLTTSTPYTTPNSISTFSELPASTAIDVTTNLNPLFEQTSIASTSIHTEPVGQYVSVSSSAAPGKGSFNEKEYFDMLRRIFPEFFTHTVTVGNIASEILETDAHESAQEDDHEGYGLELVNGQIASETLETDTPDQLLDGALQEDFEASGQELVTEPTVINTTFATIANGVMTDLISLRDLIRKIYGVVLNNMPVPLESLFLAMHNGTDHTHIKLPEHHLEELKNSSSDMITWSTAKPIKEELMPASKVQTIPHTQPTPTSSWAVISTETPMAVTTGHSTGATETPMAVTTGHSTGATETPMAVTTGHSTGATETPMAVTTGHSTGATETPMAVTTGHSTGATETPMAVTTGHSTGATETPMAVTTGHSTGATETPMAVTTSHSTGETESLVLTTMKHNSTKLPDLAHESKTNDDKPWGQAVITDHVSVTMEHNVFTSVTPASLKPETTHYAKTTEDPLRSYLTTTESTFAEPSPTAVIIGYNSGATEDESFITATPTSSKSLDLQTAMPHYTKSTDSLTEPFEITSESIWDQVRHVHSAATTHTVPRGLVTTKALYSGDITPSSNNFKAATITTPVFGNLTTSNQHTSTAKLAVSSAPALEMNSIKTERSFSTSSSSTILLQNPTTFQPDNGETTATIIPEKTALNFATSVVPSSLDIPIPDYTTDANSVDAFTSIKELLHTVSSSGTTTSQMSSLQTAEITSKKQQTGQYTAAFLTTTFGPEYFHDSTQHTNATGNTIGSGSGLGSGDNTHSTTKPVIRDITIPMTSSSQEKYTFSTAAATVSAVNSAIEGSITTVVSGQKIADVTLDVHDEVTTEGNRITTKIPLSEIVDLTDSYASFTTTPNSVGDISSLKTPLASTLSLPSTTRITGIDKEHGDGTPIANDDVIRESSGGESREITKVVASTMKPFYTPTERSEKPVNVTVPLNRLLINNVTRPLDGGERNSGSGSGNSGDSVYEMPVTSNLSNIVNDYQTSNFVPGTESTINTTEMYRGDPTGTIHIHTDSDLASTEVTTRYVPPTESPLNISDTKPIVNILSGTEPVTLSAFDTVISSSEATPGQTNETLSAFDTVISTSGVTPSHTDETTFRVITAPKVNEANNTANGTISATTSTPSTHDIELSEEYKTVASNFSTATKTSIQNVTAPPEVAKIDNSGSGSGFNERSTLTATSQPSVTKTNNRQTTTLPEVTSTDSSRSGSGFNHSRYADVENATSGVIHSSSVSTNSELAHFTVVSVTEEQKSGVPILNFTKNSISTNRPPNSSSSTRPDFDKQPSAEGTSEYTISASNETHIVGATTSSTNHAQTTAIPSVEATTSNKSEWPTRLDITTEPFHQPTTALVHEEIRISSRPAPTLSVTSDQTSSRPVTTQTATSYPATSSTTESLSEAVLSMPTVTPTESTSAATENQGQETVKTTKAMYRTPGVVTAIASAIVGRWFQYNLPTMWTRMLKKNVATHIVTNNTAIATPYPSKSGLVSDEWLAYHQRLESLCGVPVAKGKTIINQISTFKISLINDQALLSTIILHVSLYPMPESEKLDYEVLSLMDIKNTQNLDHDFKSKYSALFIEKLVPYFVQENRTLTLSDMNLLSFDFVPIHRKRRSILFTVQSVWNIQNTDLETFNSTFKQLVVDGNKPKYNFFVALLPEFIIKHINITESGQNNLKLKSFVQPIAKDDSTGLGVILAPIFIGLFAIISCTALILIRKRKAPSYLFIDRFLDKTYGPRKPIYLDDEMEMDHFKPSKARIIAEDDLYTGTSHIHKTSLTISNPSSRTQSSASSQQQPNSNKNNNTLKVKPMINSCHSTVVVEKLSGETASDSESVDGYYSFTNFSFSR